MTDVNSLSRIIMMQGTKANIEVLTADLKEGMLAYGQDTGEIGIYLGGAWVWVNVGVNSSNRSEVLMADGISGPPVPLTNEAEDDWIYSD